MIHWEVWISFTIRGKTYICAWQCGRSFPPLLVIFHSVRSRERLNGWSVSFEWTKLKLPWHRSLNNIEKYWNIVQHTITTVGEYNDDFVMWNEKTSILYAQNQIQFSINYQNCKTILILKNNCMKQLLPHWRLRTLLIFRLNVIITDLHSSLWS